VREGIAQRMCKEADAEIVRAARALDRETALMLSASCGIRATRTMTNDSIRTHCLSLPHVTEIVQWGEHLLFKVGGKMFAIIAIDGHSCSLKCTPDKYAELVEMEDILPASHNMWKYNWVTTQTLDAVPDAELRALLTESYHLVRAGLPKRVRAELDAARRPKAAARQAKKR
jgi:predicted DNA-binding protein (MmcQ/YjbR family)